MLDTPRKHFSYIEYLKGLSCLILHDLYTFIEYALPTEETLTHRRCRCIEYLLDSEMIGRGSIFLHAGDTCRLHSALFNFHANKSFSAFIPESAISLLDMCYYMCYSFHFDTESHKHLISF